MATPSPSKTTGHVDAGVPSRAGKSSSNLDFDMGLGGAVGGILAGDMITDAAAYNAGLLATAPAGLAERGRYCLLASYISIGEENQRWSLQ
ncbi:hypothetical protein GUJ93_ZPchr0007g5017 [Zizania palustris]|uniref:Uncharacterized protein n=1 Tax=Zizania palustris TaxID=103762 RepID=A0A8J5W624_ZIZPA|nr:hypothetical protein GUJ93_ZPchr0007g5017 [Zizania palustris]